MKKILIVEDDKNLGFGISVALKTKLIETELCDTLSEARKMLSQSIFDLILLDINLPDGNGMDLLREIRVTSNIPIILLTVNDMETDIVVGLESGADDYITKPFSLAVLRARVNNQLKEGIPKSQRETITGAFRFNFDMMKFLKDGSKIELSKTEQKLLRILVENKGIVVLRETLLERLWANESDFVDENALSVTIKRLRDKLEDNPAKPKYIKTIYGMGYMWAGNANE